MLPCIALHYVMFTLYYVRLMLHHVRFQHYVYVLCLNLDNTIVLLTLFGICKGGEGREGWGGREVVAVRYCR
jgi:hypothetical protein